MAIESVQVLTCDTCGDESQYAGYIPTVRRPVERKEFLLEQGYVEMTVLNPWELQRHFAEKVGDNVADIRAEVFMCIGCRDTLENNIRVALIGVLGMDLARNLFEGDPLEQIEEAEYHRDRSIEEGGALAEIAQAAEPEPEREPGRRIDLGPALNKGAGR